MCNIFFFLFVCCSHLEHRISVKHFVSFQFLHLRKSVGFLGRNISPSQGRYITQRDIHALSEIRTHYSSVGADEDISCLVFSILVWEAIGTVATPGLLCQPRVIVKMIVEKQMECRLAGETEVLGENLPQRHFCPSQNPTWPDPVSNPGRRGGKSASNRLSYGAAPSHALDSTTTVIGREQYSGY
jgi:hypothetical protein